MLDHSLRVKGLGCSPGSFRTFACLTTVTPPPKHSAARSLLAGATTSSASPMTCMLRTCHAACVSRWRARPCVPHHVHARDLCNSWAKGSGGGGGEHFEDLALLAYGPPGGILGEKSRYHASEAKRRYVRRELSPLLHRRENKHDCRPLRQSPRQAL